MIKGIGTDIVRIERIKTDFNIYSKWTSKREQDIAAKLEGRRLQEFLAGRWAAKESIFKAMTEKVHDYKLIEILSTENGPVVECGDLKIKTSISHDGEYAVAYSIIE